MDHQSTDLDDAPVEQEYLATFKKDKKKKAYRDFKERVYIMAESEIAPLEDHYKEKFLDPQALIRFFQARDHKGDKALQMWRKWVDWKIQFKIDDITLQNVMHEYESGKAFIHKHDKQGRPCIIIRTRLHFPSESNADDFMRFGLYMVHKAVAMAEEKGHKTVCVIYDRFGWRKSVNFDKRLMGLVKRLVGMLQDFYAERLAAVYILHINWFFRLIYAIVKPFLSKKTTSKVNIIKKIPDLKKFFDQDCLLAEHGGTSQYVHPYPKEEKKIEGDEEDSDAAMSDKEMAALAEKEGLGKINDTLSSMPEESKDITDN